MLIFEDTVTVKYRTAIKMLFLYFNVHLSVMLDSLSCSFTSVSFLTDCPTLKIILPLIWQSSVTISVYKVI
jgi:hypothetical protein